MKLKSIFLLVSVIIFMVIVPLFQNANAQCDDVGYITDPDSGLCIPDIDMPGADSDSPVLDVLESLMGWLLGIVGTLAVLMIVVSGIMYLVAGGDQETVDMAKRNLKWAIIGLVVSLVSWLIVITVHCILSPDYCYFGGGFWFFP